jgi:hypothetical protein
MTDALFAKRSPVRLHVVRRGPDGFVDDSTPSMVCKDCRMTPSSVSANFRSWTVPALASQIAAFRFGDADG